MNPSENVSLTRREFLIRTAFWLGATGLGIAFVHFFKPAEYSYGATSASLGLPENFAVPSVTFLAAYQAWLIRNADGFFALKAICPHLGCKPDWKPQQKQFACPCHGSAFDVDGGLLSGPSLKPLASMRLRLGDEGLSLILDEQSTAGEAFIKYPMGTRL